MKVIQDSVLNISIVSIGLILIFLNTALSEEDVEYQNLYSIKIKVFKNDSAVLDHISIINGTLSDFPKYDTQYKLILLSSDNKELFNQNISVHFSILIENPASAIEVDNVTIYTEIPYYKNAQYLVMNHNDIEILKADINKDTSNNVIVDSDKNEDLAADKATKILWTIIISVILFISLIILMVVLRKNKHTGKPSLDYNKLKEKWRKK